jgi:hypothetical protein
MARARRQVTWSCVLILRDQRQTRGKGESRATGPGAQPAVAERRRRCLPTAAIEDVASWLSQRGRGRVRHDDRGRVAAEQQGLARRPCRRAAPLAVIPPRVGTSDMTAGVDHQSGECDMFEWHGWAVIVASPEAADDKAAEARQDNVESAIQGLLDVQPSVFNEVVDCRRANGQMHVWLAGCHNHPSPEPYDLFEQIAELAPGSYGLRYSIEHGVQAGWSRRVLARGAVRVEADESLSPHIPVVEDPEPAPGVGRGRPAFCVVLPAAWPDRAGAAVHSAR